MLIGRGGGNPGQIGHLGITHDGRLKPYPQVGIGNHHKGQVQSCDVPSLGGGQDADAPDRVDLGHGVVGQVVQNQVGPNLVGHQNVLMRVGDG